MGAGGDWPHARPRIRRCLTPGPLAARTIVARNTRATAATSRPTGKAAARRAMLTRLLRRWPVSPPLTHWMSPSLPPTPPGRAPASPPTAQASARRSPRNKRQGHRRLGLRARLTSKPAGGPARRSTELCTKGPYSLARSAFAAALVDLAQDPQPSARSSTSRAERPRSTMTGEIGQLTPLAHDSAQARIGPAVSWLRSGGHGVAGSLGRNCLHQFDKTAQ